MNASNASIYAGTTPISPVRRGRLVRDQSIVDRFGLHPGVMYRVAYVAGGASSRRVSRTLVIFEGVTERRRWDGETASCLDFALPHGRSLALLGSQLVDVRPAGINERGQWVLVAQDPALHRRRASRRSPAR